MQQQGPSASQYVSPLSLREKSSLNYLKQQNHIFLVHQIREKGFSLNFLSHVVVRQYQVWQKLCVEVYGKKIIGRTNLYEPHSTCYSSPFHRHNESSSFVLLPLEFYHYIILYKVAQLCSHFTIAGIIFRLTLVDLSLFKLFVGYSFLLASAQLEKKNTRLDPDLVSILLA